MAEENGKEKGEDRPLTVFVALVRPKGEDEWTLLDERFEGRTQDEAKKVIARTLSADESDGGYGEVINGDGLEIAVTSARSFKPVLVKTQPQPAKVVIGA